MKRTLALTTLLLSAGLLSTTAQSAEFASADCVTGLNEADEQGASWYRIVQMQEDHHVNHWRVQAILYA